MKSDHALTRREALKYAGFVTGIATSGGVAATGTAAAGIGEGRIAHFTMNNLHWNTDRSEKVRNHVHDSSPHKNHGMSMGATVVAGHVGNAYAFDGDDDYIEVTVGDGETVTLENWTVAGWINPTDWSDTSRKEWLSVAEDRAGQKPLDFIHEDGRIKHYRGDAAGEVMAHDVSALSGWHHMLVTQKRVDESTVEVEMYFDGVLVDDVSGDFENMQPSALFYIGRVAHSDPDRFYWDGALDEVRVYDRVLSQAEIDDLVAMGGN